MSVRTGVRVSCAVALIAALALPAASEAAPIVPGKAIVGFDDADRSPKVVSVPDASARPLAALRDAPGVAFVEPVYRTRGTAAPANSGFSSQWALDNTGQAGGVAAADIDA